MKGAIDKKIIILVSIIMVISVFFICRYIWPKYRYVPPQIENQKPIKSETKVKKVTLQKNTTSNRREYKPDRCILKKNISDREEVIFDKENCNFDILKWKDYLIFPDGNGYPPEKEDVILYAYNIKTSEKIKIHSLDEYANDYTRRPYDIYLGEIFDVTLFFNAGGYATDQILYSLDLSDITSKPKLISSDKQYSRVSYSYGHYWVTGAFGDAGFSASKRALFDIKEQKIIGQAIETSSDLGIGTSYLGADEDSAFIASFVKKPNPQSEEEEFQTILSEIYALNLMKKKDPKTIISKKEMPSNIQSVVYMYDKKNLVLFGDDAYVYNLEEKNLKKIVSLKNVKFEGPNTVFGNTICISEKLKLDIKKKAVVSDETDCVHKNSGSENSLSEKIKGYELPSEYSFEFIEGE